MIDPDVQLALDAVYADWADEVSDMGGNPGNPTADQDLLLMLRSIAMVGPEAVYGKAMWNAIKDMSPDEVAELAQSMGQRAAAA